MNICDIDSLKLSSSGSDPKGSRIHFVQPMSLPPVKVSIVVEAGASDVDTSDASVLDTLTSITQQDYPLDRLEIIVCQHS